MLPTNTYSVDAKSIDCDHAGNSYLCSVGFYELTVTKFSNTGNLLHSFTIGDFSAQGRVNPQSILCERNTGYIYISGTFLNAVDFDPSSGTSVYNSATAMSDDGFFAKYDSALNLIWVKTFTATEFNFGNWSLDFLNGDIISAGYFEGNANLRNGTILNGVPGQNPFYLRFDTAGNILESFSLQGNASFRYLASSANNRFITSGSVANLIDMDPGAGVDTLNITGNDFVASYNSLNTDIKNINSKALFIYPNPATTELFIPSDIGKRNVKIYSNQSQLISSDILNQNETRIQLPENISSGIYLIELIGNSKIERGRIIIE